MKAACALCGRLTVPAAYIGAEPIGPTCARRAGLLKLRGAGRVRLVQTSSQCSINFAFNLPGPPALPPQTQLDLFSED
jgi:hypothetical protein